MKRPLRNKRIDAPHVRLYGWLLNSPAYLSLSCPARALLVEITEALQRQKQRQTRLVRSPGFRAMQHRARNGPACLCRTPGARLYRVGDERSVQSEGTARERMAADFGPAM